MKKQFINEPCIFYMGKYIKGAKKMSNEKKSRISKWISFAIGSLTIILKIVAEIVELIPEEEKGA